MNPSRAALVAVLAGSMIAGGLFGLRRMRSDTDSAASNPVPAVEGASLPAVQAAGEVQSPLLAEPAPAVAAGKIQPPADDRKKPEPLDPQFEAAKALAAAGSKFEARAALTKLILAAPEGARREEMRNLLDAINAELFFSRAPSPDCMVYQFAAGDNLARIARNNGKDLFFSDLLMRINEISDARKIRAGKTLKIPQGTFSVVVQKWAHRMIVLFNGHYIKEYRVAIGAPTSPTPAGAFIVGTKQPDPPWYAPDGKVYKFGDPQNILGTRWIGFEDTKEHRGYGIHGTTQPETVGQSVSFGCVRMLNSDVEEVFGMLMPKDTVVILDRPPQPPVKPEPEKAEPR